MPYLDGLPQAGGYTIDVFEAGSTVAVTVINIRRDKISEVDAVKLVPDAAGNATTGPRVIGANIGRVVITASCFSGTTAKLRIAGTTVQLAPDGTVTFDVV